MRMTDKFKTVEGSLKIVKYFPESGKKEVVFEKDNLIVLDARLSILGTLYSTPLTISTITCVGNLVTVTTSSNHNLVTSNLVRITGVTPSEYNGSFPIIVTGATTFTYYALSVIASPGSGASMRTFFVTEPDPIDTLRIGTGGGLDSRSIGSCTISISSSTLTSLTSGFLPSDVGQNMTIPGAGVGGSEFNVIITSYVSSTEVTISEAAATSVSGVSVTIGQGLFPKEEDPLQSDLVTPVATLPVTYTTDLTTPSITFLADADQSTANGLTLSEAGLFKVTGAMFNVKNYPGIPKTSDFGVHYVWTIKFA